MDIDDIEARTMGGQCADDEGIEGTYAAQPQGETYAEQAARLHDEANPPDDTQPIRITDPAIGYFALMALSGVELGKALVDAQHALASIRALYTELGMHFLRQEQHEALTAVMSQPDSLAKSSGVAFSVQRLVDTAIESGDMDEADRESWDYFTMREQGMTDEDIYRRIDELRASVMSTQMPNDEAVDKIKKALGL